MSQENFFFSSSVVCMCVCWGLSEGGNSGRPWHLHLAERRPAQWQQMVSCLPDGAGLKSLRRKSGGPLPMSRVDTLGKEEEEEEGHFFFHWYEEVTCNFFLLNTWIAVWCLQLVLRSQDTSAVRIRTRASGLSSTASLLGIRTPPGPGASSTTASTGWVIDWFYFPYLQAYFPLRTKLCEVEIMKYFGVFCTSSEHELVPILYPYFRYDSDISALNIYQYWY